MECFPACSLTKWGRVFLHRHDSVRMAFDESVAVPQCMCKSHSKWTFSGLIFIRSKLRDNLDKMFTLVGFQRMFSVNPNNSLMRSKKSWVSHLFINLITNNACMHFHLVFVHWGALVKMTSLAWHKHQDQEHLVVITKNKHKSFKNKPCSHFFIGNT